MGTGRGISRNFLRGRGWQWRPHRAEDWTVLVVTAAELLSHDPDPFVGFDTFPVEAKDVGLTATTSSKSYSLEMNPAGGNCSLIIRLYCTPFKKKEI